VAALAGQDANRRMEKPQGGLFRETGTMCGLRPEQKISPRIQQTTAPHEDGGFFVHANPGGNFNRKTTNEYKNRHPGQD
jgi:hypothetical protein